VVNNAVLSFNVNGDMTVPNEISGSGRVVQNGSGSVRLTGSNSFTGGIEVTSGTLSVGGSVTRAASATVLGVLDLEGQNMSVGALAGSGVVSNSSATATALAVGSGDTSSRFWGTIRDGAGAVSLLKTGSGTLTLSGLNTYSGSTVIGGGTVRLIGTQTELVTNGLAYRLDALRRDLLTITGSNVSMWADASAAGVNFTQSVAVLQPVYVTNAVTGLPAVRFNGYTNCMGSSKAAIVQTAFIVNTVRGFMGGGGLWGQNNGDFGIRQASLTSWTHPGNANDFSCGGRMFINNVETNRFMASQPHILTANSSTAKNWSTAIGDCRPYNGTIYRSYNGDVNEVLVYSNEVSASDRYAVTDFLRYKWLGAGLALPTNVLPTATALVVSNNAALDLNGISQAVGSLSGAGSVANGSGAWSTLTVGNDNTSTLFSGVLSGSNALVKAGSGTLTLAGANAYFGHTLVSGGMLSLAGGANRLPVGGTVAVASGATLNLNGQAQTLAGIGGSGSVSGGGLTVTGTVAPGDLNTVGTLTLENTPTLSGSVLLIDTRADGTCDTLAVSDALSLSGLTLQIADVAQMAGRSYEIVTCAGNLTETLSATPNLPATWLVRYDRTPGAGKVLLIHNFGTLLSIR
jgi:autotransporter-associated beta strand protein